MICFFLNKNGYINFLIQPAKMKTSIEELNKVSNQSGILLLAQSEAFKLFENPEIKYDNP
ncbi:MAG: hypothetical protein CVT94_16475 [Bacteroidetes bacterium HGW-Bacteroidetes-11]|nr:MAG: hypothetical protein CVT94_16475 [Bacteroidetes bacterium HGW-Bacteroidetes-11]